MSAKWKSQYQQKLRTADDAVSVVKSGDVIFMGEFAQNIEVLDAALARRKGALTDIILETTTRTRPLKCVEVDPKREVFTWGDWHFSGVGRKYSEQGLANYIPFTYHQGPRAVTQYNKVDVAFVQVTPMDDKGFFNFSTSCEEATKSAR